MNRGGSLFAGLREKRAYLSARTKGPLSSQELQLRVQQVANITSFTHELRLLLGKPLSSLLLLTPVSEEIGHENEYKFIKDGWAAYFLATTELENQKPDTGTLELVAVVEELWT